MKFPFTEPEVVALADAMIAGLTAHALDFPSVSPAGLTTMLNNYRVAKLTQDDARVQALIATDDKNNRLGALTTTMKNDLKLAEVDTSSDPEKLAQIGWGPKADPTPIIPPNQPTNLTPLAEGTGTLTLKWDKPSNGSTGGAVRNYLIQRRDKNNGEFGSWTLIDTRYETELQLAAQPQGISMEYRVIASNAAGESNPTNVATVVL